LLAKQYASNVTLFGVNNEMTFVPEPSKQNYLKVMLAKCDAGRVKLLYFVQSVKQFNPTLAK
jgi:hypothetical protein